MTYEAMAASSSSDAFLHFPAIFFCFIRGLDCLQSNNFIGTMVETGIFPGFSSRDPNQQMALKVLVEGQMYHRRALDSVHNVVMPNPICSQRASKGFKIYSQMHERNLPFQVFCTACQQPTAHNQGPTTFYVLRQRSTHLYDDATNLVPESVFLHQHVMRNTSDAGQIYGLERHIDQQIEGLHELNPDSPSQLQKALGELRVNSALCPNLLNGLSMVCARASGNQGNERPMDVLFHMDTLRHPVFNGDKNCGYDKTDRFRIGDLEPFNAQQTKLLLPVHKQHLNLKLDLRWNPWSCCSACCCTKQVCGGFRMSPILCQQMDSFQTRLGYVVFLKIDSSKPLDFLNQLLQFCGKHFRTHKVDADHLKEAMDSLNDHLNTEPYSTQGIPIFSTLLQSNVLSSTILLAFLNQEFNFYPDHSAESLPGLSVDYPFGSLGQFVDIKTCSNDDPQKVDCNQLRKCQQNLQ
uniref:Uncharacterized protein n=1 Tax=Ditylenchus dipsaci TaxID=166011 RepID=A0A915EPW9_9BILA